MPKYAHSFCTYTAQSLNVSRNTTVNPLPAMNLSTNTKHKAFVDFTNVSGVEDIPLKSEKTNVAHELMPRLDEKENVGNVGIFWRIFSKMSIHY